jgi:hypothetical protein
MRHWVWRAWHHRQRGQLRGCLCVARPVLGVLLVTRALSRRGIGRMDWWVGWLAGWLAGWRAGKSWGKVEWSAAVM